MLFVVFVFGVLPLMVFSIPDPIRMIKKNGYPAEKHVVTTEDGYVTVVHRIPHGKKKKIIGEPVLVAHGLTLSSVGYLNGGPSKGLAYVLADSGYDVWLSNCRGNTYSIEVTPKEIDTNSKAFNNFSLHDMGMYDYPAQIDYVLNYRNKSKLFYIGHSQGGAAFYAMTSKRPEYNDKIRLASLLAAPAIMNHSGSIVRFLSEFAFQLEDLVDRLHIYNTPLPGLITKTLPAFCAIPFNNKICRLIYNIFYGYEDSGQVEFSMLSTNFQAHPSDFSLKCLLHFAQIMKSGVFQEYDYRKEGNFKEYGSENPPRYNLSAVTAPVALYYGLNDQFVNEEDLNAGARLLPNVVNKYCVPWKKWNHGDFLQAKDVVKLLYKEVLRVMKLY